MTQKNKSTIALIDMQSFYASVEKAANPEYKDKPLVVAGDPERRSGIILAACPIAKKYGVTTAEALWQALQKCPDLVVMRPRMEKYLETSMLITKILESYSDLVEPYSIDELFIDITGTLHLFGNSIKAVIKSIQDRIMMETGIYARAGISENKVTAKLCCDLISKKIDGGIFYLEKDELNKHIWDKPVGDMWGIGSRMQKHLYVMGIRTIGELANTPVKRLQKKWGVNGLVIWRTANGIDDSPVTPTTHAHQKVIGNGMTLPRDFREAWEIEVVLLDLCSQICRRTREKGLMGSVVSMGLGGADWDHPTGFSRQMKLLDPTNVTLDVYAAVKKIFYKHWDRQPVRRLSVALSNLSSADTYQLSLFEDTEKKRAIDKVMDEIKDRFGEISILRASSLTTAGQAIDRAAKIGGHYK
ncbi:DNA polymerase IV [Paenibacillus sp. MMO-58]|uniref:DNA polymerase IV n=1 Tax=Paenibacillus sp. MMO-58 TaxID=3081290 RepID=UPI003015FA89